jgi:formyl-CoA transferase
MHPPLLGEHTNSVLAEIGITGEVLKAFEADGAFLP